MGTTSMVQSGKGNKRDCEGRKQILRWARKEKKKAAMFLDIINDGAMKKLDRKSTRGETLFWYAHKQCVGSDSRCSSWRLGPLYHSDHLCRKEKNKRIWHGHVLKRVLNRNESISWKKITEIKEKKSCWRNHEECLMRPQWWFRAYIHS